MFHPRFRAISCAVVAIAVWILPGTHSKGATLIADPDEAGLRATIDAAQDGDIVVLNSRVELFSTLQIGKRLTFQVNSAEAYRIWIEGSFEGPLLQISADGIVFEGIRLIGSPKTDGLFVETNVVLRDGRIENCRRPVVSDVWTTVRLERVAVLFNHAGFECAHLEAKDSTFSFNAGSVGAGGWTANLEGCRIENNLGDGLILTYGSAKNCTFRFNGGFGLRFDPDPGVLSLKGCLFYANTGGGILLREEAIATVDNCTFTRHTGLPAIVVSEAHEVLFRHCTVTDNVVIGGGEPGLWPSYPVGGSFAIMSTGRAELQNCLIADNPTNDAPHASGLVGEWVDGGGNVIGGPAHLTTLSDNGGPTLSLLPLPGSPAIDAGVPSDLVHDARGVSRLAGTAPDAGATEAGATFLADEDADGLPDIWERFYSLNPADRSDALSDRDGDGQNALAEFRSHTDPADRESVHRISEFRLAPVSVFQPFPRYAYLIWRIYPGVTYEVETSADLRQWCKIPGPYYLAGRENGRQTLLQEIRADSPMSFYRVVVRENIFD